MISSRKRKQYTTCLATATRLGGVCVILAYILIEGVATCPHDTVTPPAMGRFLHSVPDRYVIFECNQGYQFLTASEGIIWCNRVTAKWGGNPGTCISSGKCQPSNPCQNDGVCSEAEDPFGWGYYCYCPQDYVGGRHCQIMNPCNVLPCPPNSTYCHRSYTSDRGRYCYSATWEWLD